MPGSDGDHARKVRAHRARRIVLTFVVAAVLIVIVILSRHTLAESLQTLGHLNWTWFLLALVFEAVSLAAFGLSRRRLLRAEGDQARFGSVMAITYAGNALSMSVPFAGTQLAVVYTYRHFRRHGVGPAVTGWALAVSAILSTSALALVLVIGAVAGGAATATAAGFAGAAVFTVPALAVLLALREFLDRVASIKVPWPRYAEVFSLAVLNWLADCGCLACAILATGNPVPWHSLLLVYGAGAAVGSTGVTPGGFAVVEVTLTATLTAAGLGAASALAAVLTYRLINFWLILVGGWVTIPVLAHRHRPQVPAPAGDRGPDDRGAGDRQASDGEPGAPARHERMDAGATGEHTRLD